MVSTVWAFMLRAWWPAVMSVWSLVVRSPMMWAGSLVARALVTLFTRRWRAVVESMSAMLGTTKAATSSTAISSSATPPEPTRTTKAS